MSVNRFLLASLFLCILMASPSGARTIHVLSQGETLYSLAQRYEVNLEDIIKENSIDDPSLLSVGMKLVIPNQVRTNQIKSNEAVQYHQVVKDDTYYSIAKRYNMDLKEFLQLNKRNSSQVLSIGERLRVSGAVQSAVANTPVSQSYELRETVSERFQWPVSGTRYALTGKLSGVAIEAEPMSYVHAVNGGQVVWTGPYRGFGNVVLVDSQGYIYLYGGNEDVFVNIGQTVETGNRIGRLGSSGANGGLLEMYFSVFREGVPVPPEDAPRG